VRFAKFSKLTDLAVTLNLNRARGAPSSLTDMLGLNINRLKMKFNIDNPSDPYTLEADDLQIAAVACCLLGNGQYGLTGIGDSEGQDVPIFLLGGADEWFTEKFGTSYEDTATNALNNRNDALARAFESVTLCQENRSSINDIGGKASEIAKAIRRKAAEMDGAN
jgi:hypothetical protein